MSLTARDASYVGDYSLLCWFFCLSVCVFMYFSWQLGMPHLQVICSLLSSKCLHTPLDISCIGKQVVWSLLSSFLSGCFCTLFDVTDSMKWLACRWFAFCIACLCLYMPVCLSVFLSACVPAYLPAYQPACPSDCLLAFLPASLPVCLLFCCYACRPACLPKSVCV